MRRVFPVLLLALLFSGCGSSVRRTELRLPLYGEVSNLDPARATSSAAMFTDSLLYSGLMKFSPDLHVIPDLAVSLPTISADGRTYVFTIRQDARFPDGTKCTAATVAFSLARALRPEIGSSLARAYMGNIVGAGPVERGRAGRLSGVTASGLSLTIHLVRPDAQFLDKLAFPVASVVPERIGFHPIDWTPDLGTGPFALRRLDHGMLLLIPRPHGYGGALHVRGLTLIPVRSHEDGYARYKAGSLDAALVPFARYAALQARTDFHSSPSLDAWYAQTTPALDRQLAARLDRAQLARDAAPSFSALEAIVPPAIPDYFPAGEQTAASSSPLPALHVVAPSDAGSQAVVQALRHQWPVQATGRLVRIVRASFTLPDPGVWLDLVPHSRWIHRLVARTDEMTNDPVGRLQSYNAAESYALAQGLLVPLVSGNRAYLIRPAIQGLQVTPFGLMPQNNSWTSVSTSL